MSGIGAGHDWLAKVLTGDPVACWVLALARNLPTDEWDTLARSVERIRAGMPGVEVLAQLQRERSERPG